MNVKYRIGTNKRGNFKVSFIYKEPVTGIGIQETHHLLCTADTENVEEVMKYTISYIRDLKTRSANMQTKEKSK